MEYTYPIVLYCKKKNHHYDWYFQLPDFNFEFGRPSPTIATTLTRAARVLSLFCVSCLCCDALPEPTPLWELPYAYNPPGNQLHYAATEITITLPSLKGRYRNRFRLPLRNTMIRKTNKIMGRSTTWKQAPKESQCPLYTWPELQSEYPFVTIW